MTEALHLQPGLYESAALDRAETSLTQIEGSVKARRIMEGISESDKTIVEQGVREGIVQYTNTTAAVRAQAAAVKAFPMAQRTVRLLSEGVTDSMTLDEMQSKTLVEARNLMNNYNVYDDATLAGSKARERVNAVPDEEPEKSSLEDKALSAYHELLANCGYGQEDAAKAVTEMKTAWASRAQQAGKKFLDSILPGDIMLEHYTPYALGPILGDGLKPKDGHAVTSVNRRSKLVHFTSRGDIPGAWGTDISSYTGVRAQTLRRMDEDPSLTPVSGMFMVPLASLIEMGVRMAHFTPKVVDGRPHINDIVLANGEGMTASIGLDSLLFVPATMGDPNGLLGDRVARLPYDAALNKEIEELKDRHGPDERTWAEFVQENLDSMRVAKQVLIERGADPAWVNTHVSSKEEAGRMASTRHQQVIVPLAAAKMDKENIDGKLDRSDQQTAFLGIAEIAA